MDETKIPDGWRLVPVEPTEEMLEAMRTQARVRLEQETITASVENGRAVWGAMLDAAPEPPAIGRTNNSNDSRDASGRLLDRRVSQRWYPSKTQSVSFWCPTCNCYQQRSRIDGKCPFCRPAG